MRKLGLIWCICVALLLATFISVLPNARINSNLFDLLPSDAQTLYSQTLVDNFTKTIDQQLIWLIASETQSTQSAAYWVDLLENTAGISEIVGRKSEADLSEWAKEMQRFPMLLSDNLSSKMASGDYVKWVLSQIYSPFSGISIAEIQNDPLLLTRANVLEQLSNNSTFSIQDGWVSVTAPDGQKWLMIRAVVDDNLQGMLDKKQLVETLEMHYAALMAQYPDAQLLKKGSIYYTDFAIKTAETDIATIGMLSVFGVILVFFWVFRSFKAIGVTLLALSIGLLAGCVTVLLLYGEIHIITIVMSTSIIGVSVDYTLFYLTARMLTGGQYTPQQTLQQIGKPLLGALISTLLAYCVLVFAPFAGLAQLAVFTMSGLIAVFLTVICWFPIIADIKQREPKRLLAFSSQLLNVVQKSQLYQKILPLFILLISIVGLYQLTHNDDVGALQTLPQNLWVEDQKMGEILQQSTHAQVLMVTGKSAEDALINLEASYSLFDEWGSLGIIEGYKKYPFQSSERQQENLQLLQALSVDLQKLYDEEGIELLTGLLLENETHVDKDEWLQSPLSEGWQLLWETLPSGESAIIVSLDKVLDVPMLIDALKNSSNLFWIDRKSDVSDLFSNYRVMMEWLLVIAMALIFALFIMFKGFKQGFRMTIPILLAVIFPLGMMGLFGQTLNLFNVLSLILVVGMGIDYVLFFSSTQGSRQVALITIIMAAIISELTFGLLAMSGTNAIAGFGLMLLLGIATALLLSPLAIDKKDL